MTDVVVTPRRHLKECEAIIERGFSTFVEVGFAIRDIHAGELYTTHGYLTFEDYMERRWGWTRDQGYKQINAAQLGRLLSENVYHGIHPTAERQLRPLSRLAKLPDYSDGMVIDVWQDAAHVANEGRDQKDWGPPTAALVKAAVDARMPPDEPAPEDFSHVSLLQGKMEDWLPTLGQVQCLVTDPPYGVTEHAWDKAEHEQWLEIIRGSLAADYSFFWFCPSSLVADNEMALRRLKMPIQSRIIWHRRNMSLGSHAKARFIDTWEMIFHVGNRDLNFPIEWDDAWFDVQTFAAPQSNFEDKKVHPTQKPVDMVSRLVRFGSFPGETVVDPFAGAGTTGAACPKDRKGVLIERDPGFVQIIEQRLNVTGQAWRR